MVGGVGGWVGISLAYVTRAPVKAYPPRYTADKGADTRVHKAGLGRE